MDHESNTSHGSETIEDAVLVIETALVELEKLRFNTADFRQHFIVGLQLSIVEQAHSALILLKGGMVFDAKIILRSTLEHYVELTNCTKDHSYCFAVQEKFVWNIKKTLTEAQNGNPFFARIAAEIPIDDEMADWEQKSLEIKSLGGRKKLVDKKFLDAGLQNEYNSIYRSLSNLVHPTYAGLIERHFEIQEESDEFKVVSFKEPPAVTIGVVCQVICFLVNDSQKQTTAFLEDQT